MGTYISVWIFLLSQIFAFGLPAHPHGSSQGSKPFVFSMKNKFTFKQPSSTGSNGGFQGASQQNTPTGSNRGFQGASQNNNPSEWKQNLPINYDPTKSPAVSNNAQQEQQSQHHQQQQNPYQQHSSNQPPYNNVQQPYNNQQPNNNQPQQQPHSGHEAQPNNYNPYPNNHLQNQNNPYQQRPGFNAPNVNQGQVQHGGQLPNQHGGQMPNQFGPNQHSNSQPPLQQLSNINPNNPSMFQQQPQQQNQNGFPNNFPNSGSMQGGPMSPNQNTNVGPRPGMQQNNQPNFGAPNQPYMNHGQSFGHQNVPGNSNPSHTMHGSTQPVPNPYGHTQGPQNYNGPHGPKTGPNQHGPQTGPNQHGPHMPPNSQGPYMGPQQNGPNAGPPYNHHQGPNQHGPGQGPAVNSNRGPAAVIDHPKPTTTTLAPKTSTVDGEGLVCMTTADCEIGCCFNSTGQLLDTTTYGAGGPKEGRASGKCFIRSPGLGDVCDDLCPCSMGFECYRRYAPNYPKPGQKTAPIYDPETAPKPQRKCLRSPVVTAERQAFWACYFDVACSGPLP